MRDNQSVHYTLTSPISDILLSGATTTTQPSPTLTSTCTPTSHLPTPPRTARTRFLSSFLTAPRGLWSEAASYARLHGIIQSTSACTLHSDVAYLGHSASWCHNHNPTIADTHLYMYSNLASSHTATHSSDEVLVITPLSGKRGYTRYTCVPWCKSLKDWFS